MIDAVRRGLAALALAAPPVALVLLALAGRPAGASETLDLGEWPRGPIRYISRADEIKTYKALTKDEDRILYIERFWARRDPTPQTLTNEYRQLFWERVNQANAMFIDSARPGWMSDRGKIHILYGPPNEIQDATNAETPEGGRGVIRWIYNSRPGGRRDLDPVVVVPFVRTTGGAYELSYDPQLASIFFDPTIMSRSTSAMDRWIEARQPMRSELSVLLDLGKMQEVPPQARVLLESVETVEAYQTETLGVRLDRFRHPDRAGSLVVVTVDCGRMTAATPSILARFVPLDATRPERVMGEDSFRYESGERYRVGQGRVVLDPGEYEVTVFAVDPETAATGLFRGRFGEPPRPARPELSDVVLAAVVEPLPYAALASYDEPFHVGAFRVVPKVDRTFARGDAINLFYEIYDAEPPYRVSYQLLGLEHDGSWVRLGQPAQAERSDRGEAWALPTTERWPLGEYRIRVEIEDRGERRFEAEVPFTLRDRADG